MKLDDALALVAGSYCLHVDDFMAKVTQSVRVSSGPLLPGDLTTWLVKGGHFFTLIKAGGKTLVYCHANELLYYASPHVELGPSCPDAHAFLVQTVEDREASGALVPRVLVTDMVHPCAGPPQARGEALRALSGAFSHVCHLQWAGDRACLQRFVASGAIPHEVGGLVALRAPLELVLDAPEAPDIMSRLPLLVQT